MPESRKRIGVPNNGNRILRLPTIPSDDGSSPEDAPRSRRTARARRSTANGTSAATPGVIPMNGPHGVRWEKVRSAKARIAVDYYDRENVKLQILDAVLREISRP